MRRRSSLLFAALSLLLGVAARAGEVAAPAWDEQAAFDYSQAARGQELGDYVLRDRHGRPLRLASYRGKPLVVNMAYTGCSFTCPLIIQTLYRAVQIAQDAFGADAFAVVTIGFDARRDTPGRMRDFARTQGVDLPGWEFLAADQATIDALAADLGFVFFPSAKGFDHLAQTTVADEQGRVYRQIYDSDFEPPQLVEPLKELIFGRRADIITLAGLIDRVRLFCTLYDPVSGRYSFDYSVLVGAFIGAASLIGFGVIAVRGWWRVWRLRGSA